MYTTVGAFLNIKEVRNMSNQNVCAREMTYEEVKESLEKQIKAVIKNHAKYGKPLHEVAIDLTKMTAFAISEASVEAKKQEEQVNG